MAENTVPQDVDDLQVILDAAKHDLLLYTKLCDPQFIASVVHVAIAKKLQDIAEGKLKRLIISCPPRHGKTRLSCIEFPTWMLGKEPKKKIVTASYSQDLSETSSKEARKRIAENEAYKEIFATTLAADDASQASWSTTEGGRYKAVGIGGSLTGHGADCILPGTLIATNIGDIPIEHLHSIAHAISVLSYDEQAKKTVFKKITAIGSRKANGFYRITTASGKVVNATQEHPFFTGEGYTVASKLAIGDRLLCKIEIETKSDSVAMVEYLCQPTVVYNIQVEGTENFFANDVLVHNCLIVDDAIKDFREAHSLTARENVWNWFWSTAWTRLSPGGAVIVISTRWHEDDLIGRLIDPDRKAALEAEGHTVEQWEVINLSAIAGLNDPIGRKPGQPLFPERFNEAALAAIKASVGSYIWSALYDGRPSRKGGNYIPIDRLRIVPSYPKGLRWFRYWDLASSEKKSADYTAGIAGALDPEDGTFYLRDCVFGQYLWPEARERIALMAEAERITIGVEAVSGFKTAYYNLLEVMPSHITCREYGADRDKLVRALPWIAMVEKGKVALVQGDWNVDFIIQAESFPKGANDDIMDAVSGVYKMCSTGLQAAIPYSRAYQDRFSKAMASRRVRSLPG